MIATDDINAAQRQIADLILEQCKHGQPSATLPNEMAACGQFLGQTARNRKQRGLHGTAAALCVLGALGTSEADGVVRRIVQYLSHRFEVETKEEIGFDKENVIKMSEVLYALQQVKPGVATTEDISKQFADTLIRSMQGDSGWSYFVDSPGNSVEELPTAYALRALAAYGAPEVVPVARQLFGALKRNAATPMATKTSDVYVDVFALFVLTFSNVPESIAPKSELKKVFFKYWRRLRHVLKEDIEQNIEYWKDESNYLYVRVPWQLYLLALAARLAPHRAFATVTAQTRIDSIISDVTKNGGFRYPHSGDLPSCRTNAILYDVLQILQTDLQKSNWFAPLHAWDRIVELSTSKLALIGGALIAFSVIAYSIIMWVYDPKSTVADLAPNIVASVLLALLLSRRPGD
jgi:hypothetical protein